MLRPFSLSIKKDDEKGQALFELIVFLPLMIYLFTVFLTIGNSINASINQQKSVRGYAYYLLKGNSNFPDSSDIESAKGSALGTIGMYRIGWREKAQGPESFAPCFKFNQPLISGDSENAVDPDEKCDSSSSGKVTSLFVKVFTMYGLCGAQYSDSTGNGNYSIYGHFNGASAFWTAASCQVQAQ